MATPATLKESFNKQVDRLIERAKDTHKAITEAQPESVKWNYPTDWEGDPVTDLDEMHEPFNRDEANQDFIDAIKTPNTGKSGDLIVSTIQVEYMAIQERAFRLRHLTRVRAAIHAAARMKSHSEKGGLFERNHRGFLERILKASARPLQRS